MLMPHKPAYNHPLLPSSLSLSWLRFLLLPAKIGPARPADLERTLSKPHIVRDGEGGGDACAGCAEVEDGWGYVQGLWVIVIILCSRAFSFFSFVVFVFFSGGMERRRQRIRDVQKPDGVDEEEVLAGALVQEPVGAVDAQGEVPEGRRVHWGALRQGQRGFGAGG